ncbi:lipopolysaccharide biosynthesis protein [Sphingobium subterraneum]|uniref:PST family polysaccharide transporter n=1 Tax=Sphingobium subterraneum TaxID=627688 RepID=A0A841IW37_9SPHN|nr:lipopolysaccharide biosynthesis protein [Sphingobium subterraneum]MBB6122480.1 PST family polysaccharide transporter [Sphingobium subterraneum]
MKPFLTRDERNARVLNASTEGGGWGKRAVRGGVISISAQVVRMVIAIGGTAVLSRLLGPSDFGLIAMAGTITSFVSMFADMGLSTSTVQRPSIGQTWVSTLMFINIGIGLALMAVTMAVAPVAAWVFSDPRVTLITMALAVALPITAAGAQHNALLSRSMNWFAIQCASIVGQLIGLITAILFISFTSIGYWGLVMQAVIGALISTFLSWRFCDWRPSWTLDWSMARQEVSMGVGITGNGINNYFQRQLDNGLIGWWWGARELGFYSRGYNLFYTLQLFASLPIAMVLMPLLSRSQHDADYWKRNVLDAAAVASMGNGLVAAVFTCLSVAMVHFLLGPGWDKSGMVILYLAPSIMLFNTSVLNAVFMARRDMRGLLWSGAITTALFAVAFLVSLRFGVVAMAAAYSVVMLVTLPISVYLAFRADVVRQRDYYRVVLPFVLCGVVTIAVYMRFVPDPLGAIGFVQIVLRGMGLGAFYCALALAVFWFDPVLAPLKARVMGYLKHWQLPAWARRSI